MMRDSEQKIEFLLSTVHRAVIMCQERNKGKGGGGDISGLVTNSILICSNFTLKDQCNKVYLQTQSRLTSLVVDIVLGPRRLVSYT